MREELRADTMTKKEVAYFHEGLKIFFDETGIKKGVFSENVTSAENLSSIINGKRGTSPSMREKLAKKSGKTIMELVQMGRERLEPTRQIAAIEPTEDNPMDVIEAVTALVKKHAKTIDDMRFWRLVFEGLPIAALIICKGNVCYQNTMSLELGDCVGAPLCENCAGKCGADCKKCPVVKGQKTMQPESCVMSLAGRRHRVSVTPMTFKDDTYFIVTSTFNVEQ